MNEQQGNVFDAESAQWAERWSDRPVVVLWRGGHLVICPHCEQAMLPDDSAGTAQCEQCKRVYGQDGLVAA